MLIVGDHEMEEKGVSVRLRSGENKGTMALKDFLNYFDKQLNKGI